MCSLVFQCPNSRVKLFYISTLLPKRLGESDIRGLVYANTAWFCHDQDHFSSVHCGNKNYSIVLDLAMLPFLLVSAQCIYLFSS